MPAKRLRPLWRCPQCGARFVTRNLWHSCGRFTLAALFAKSEPRVLPLFKKFAAMVRASGPGWKMIPQKTRVVFMVRVRAAGAYPRKDHFVAGLGSARLIRHPRFFKTVSHGKSFHGHYLRVAKPADLDAQVRRWLRESWALASQQHPAAGRRGAP